MILQVCSPFCFLVQHGTSLEISYFCKSRQMHFIKLNRSWRFKCSVIHIPGHLSSLSISCSLSSLLIRYSSIMESVACTSHVTRTTLNLEPSGSHGVAIMVSGQVIFICFLLLSLIVSQSSDVPHFLHQNHSLLMQNVQFSVEFIVSVWIVNSFDHVYFPTTIISSIIAKNLPLFREPLPLLLVFLDFQGNLPNYAFHSCGIYFRCILVAYCCLLLGVCYYFYHRCCGSFLETYYHFLSFLLFMWSLIQFPIFLDSLQSLCNFISIYQSPYSLSQVFDGVLAYQIFGLYPSAQFGKS